LVVYIEEPTNVRLDALYKRQHLVSGERDHLYSKLLAGGNFISLWHLAFSH